MSGTINYKGLANLVWDDEWIEWNAEVVLEGNEKIELVINYEDKEKDDTTGFDIANEVYEEIKKDENKFKAYVAESLLKVYSEFITKEQFINKILLEAVNIDSDGSFKLYYDDADLFLGKVICLEVNGDFKIEKAFLIG